MALEFFYPLNDNAASTTVVATTGSNGTLRGGDNTSVKATTGPGGTITYAFDLNGSDDNIDCSAHTLTNYTGAFTFSWWANFDSFTNAVFFVRNANSARKIQQTSTTNMLFQTSLSDSNFATGTLTTGVWYHFFLTRTAGGSVNLYINGTISSTGALSNGSNFNMDSIGGYLADGTGVFNGKIAQVRRWNTDESASVATYYAEGVSAGGLSIPVAMNQYRQRWR